MTEQGAGAAGAEQEPETPATTEYVVLVVHDVMAPETANGGAPELWREAGVLSVPQRTQRATVVQKAGEMAAGFTTDDGMSPVRFRVHPLAEQSAGEAVLETPAPQLTVTPL